MYFLRASLEVARKESKAKLALPQRINPPPIMDDIQYQQGKDPTPRSPEPPIRESNDVNLESPGAQSSVAKID